MKNQVYFLIVLFSFMFLQYADSQEISKTSRLFTDSDLLSVKLNYSNAILKKKTNDSVYLQTKLLYSKQDSWDSLNIEIRKRGNFRLKKCYFAPVKVKIKKSEAKKTPFKGNKKLKLVLPCLLNKSANDYVLKEYIAYKIYEILSPYHFKTRLVNIDLKEVKKKKNIVHNLKGFFIEDDKLVAKRHDAKIAKVFIHPLNQDAVCSVKNSFFQFMIGNTDFSVAISHNEKLLYLDSLIVPVPYDFDMSGLVNASYSQVSTAEKNGKLLKSVKERLYRGFKRDINCFNDVRKEVIEKKAMVFELINGLENQFNDPKQFLYTKEYIQEFYSTLENKDRFKEEILNFARLN